MCHHIITVHRYCCFCIGGSESQSYVKKVIYFKHNKCIIHETIIKLTLGACIFHISENLFLNILVGGSKVYWGQQSSYQTLQPCLHNELKLDWAQKLGICGLHNCYIPFYYQGKESRVMQSVFILRGRLGNMSEVNTETCLGYLWLQWYV